jgi:hypothetical protein
MTNLFPTRIVSALADLPEDVIHWISSSRGLAPVRRGSGRQQSQWSREQILSIVTARAVRAAGADVAYADAVLLYISSLSAERLEHEFSIGRRAILTLGTTALPLLLPPYKSLSDVGIDLPTELLLDPVLRLTPVAVDVAELWKRLNESIAKLERPESVAAEANEVPRAPGGA